MAGEIKPGKKPKPGLPKDSIKRIFDRLAQEPDFKQVLPQISGGMGNAGAGVGGGIPSPVPSSSPTPAPMPTATPNMAAQMSPSAATGIPNVGMSQAPTPTPTPSPIAPSPIPTPSPTAAPGMMQQAKNAFSKPFGGTKFPTGAASIAALIAPNAIKPFTPEGVDPYIDAAGQGAAIGAFGGPVGMGIGAAGGLAVQAGSDVGQSSAPGWALPAIGMVSPVGMAAALGSRFFGGDDKDKKPEIAPLNYAQAARDQRDQFFSSLQTMGISKDDTRYLKTIYDMRVGGPISVEKNPNLTGVTDLSDFDDPRVANFYKIHQEAINEVTGLAGQIFGEQRAIDAQQESEQTQYDRQQSTQDQLIAALTAAQDRELQSQNDWMEQQQGQYQAAITQQQDFANTAQQWTANYLAPFQQRLQESAASQAAYLREQAVAVPQNAQIYNDLAASVEFQAQQSVQNQAHTGQLMPQMVYQQQVAALSPPSWGNYQSQGPSAYEQLILQALGNG